MVKAKVYVLQKHFDGPPKEGDVKLIEEELPPIKNGEFLAEAIYLSVDSEFRFHSAELNIGDTALGNQIAKIIESKNPKYPVGQYVEGYFGWRTHTISDGKPLLYSIVPTLVPNFGDLPLSLGLGVLGLAGHTAYFGLLEICKPRAGETVVVTSAGGAVGSHVGQIAKIKGCKVVGITGSDEKGKWLVEELGFDNFINYKTADLNKALTEVAPEGVDCYFDNVGGEMCSIILRHMNSFGRIALCGITGSYNDYNNADALPKVSIVQRPLISFNLKMEGIIVTRWTDKWIEGIKQNIKWIKEGKLKYKETVTEGFENIFAAFIDMLKGGNTGKAVVKV